MGAKQKKKDAAKAAALLMAWGELPGQVLLSVDSGVWHGELVMRLPSKGKAVRLDVVVPYDWCWERMNGGFLRVSWNGLYLKNCTTEKVAIRVGGPHGPQEIWRISGYPT